jgi:hypothetical protein
MRLIPKVLRDRRPAEVRWVALSLILTIATLGCGVGSYGLYLHREGEQQQERESDRATDTTEARKATCIGFNIEQQGDRASALNGALVLFGFAEAGDLTAADREAIVSTLAMDVQFRYRQIERQAAVDNPFRDCSPAGIAAYYETEVADPATAGP